MEGIIYRFQEYCVVVHHTVICKAYLLCLEVDDGVRCVFVPLSRLLILHLFHESTNTKDTSFISD